MTTKKRLGRGLDALLSSSREDKQTFDSEKSNDTLEEIPLESLQRGRYQPRIDMRQESLEELASSIKSQGIVQPLAVRPVASNSDTEARYEIIAGERRWRAAQIADLKSVPVVIKNIPDSDAIAMALIENIQRENLNPIEIAISFQRLIKECNLTQEECGNKLGKKRSTITNFLRLLKLPSEIQDGLKKENISVGHARALINIKDRKNQLNIFNDIIENGFSVREVEQIAKYFSERNYNYSPKRKKIDSDDIIPFGHQKKLFDLSKSLNIEIQLKRNKKGNGKIIIPFTDDDKLSEIFNKIKI